MSSSTRNRVLALSVVSALSVAVIVGQQAQPSGIYTTQQATRGQGAYVTNCAGCHRPDLGGTNEAPQLAGGNFLNTWGTRTTADLLNYIQSSMPPANPGGLGQSTYLDTVAYILQANG